MTLAYSSRVDDLAAVVGRARRGDRDAFAELYRRFHRAVHGVVLARTSYGEAADLTQDTFALALARLPQLADAAAFPGWLMTIARNRAIDHVRGRKPTDELADIPVPAPRTAEVVEVLAALRALPEAYRETLILRLVEGMTGPEIAEQTGLAPGSVRVNLHRGMKSCCANGSASRPTKARHPMSDDYLWDRSGSPDPDIAKLEQLLAPLGHDAPLRRRRRRTRTLSIAAGVGVGAAAAITIYLALPRPKPCSGGVGLPFAGAAATSRVVAHRSHRACCRSAAASTPARTRPI